MTSTTELVTRTTLRLVADPARVISRLFVPGQEGFDHLDSRAGVVLQRLLALDDEEVLVALDDVITRFDARHRDLGCTFRRHARELSDRLRPGQQLSEARKLL
ncbi:MAG TPA: glycosidase, partial [Mycobacterium sp.]|nr:glycosidase [Mycobacterium sp.]